MRVSHWASLVLVAIGVCANAAQANELEPVQPVGYKKTSAAKQIKQYIVELQASSELAVKNQLAKSANANKGISAQTLRSHQQVILQQQRDTISRLKQQAPDLQVERQFNAVLNGIAVSTAMTAQQLAKMPNVKNVYPVNRYRTKLSNALPIVQAQEAWQLLGGREQAGRGTRIAIIDSGIVPTHPMFSGSGFQAPSSLPNDDYCRTSSASFCNNKLIVARYYKPSFIDDSFGEYDSPLGLSGHGTHVAGIATGRQVTASNGDTISGVAPGAYLMIYKALWGQDGEGTDIELVAALEDAVRDGADVINNSWGGSNGLNPANSVYNNIFNQIEASGVVLVTAAGNEGQDDEGNIVPQSIACPGCVEAGITVGASTTDLAFGVPVTVGAERFFSVPGNTFSLSSALTAQARVAPQANVLGCNAWDTNLSGAIAVVSRGTCTFEQKADLAEQAGATALIVINNVPGRAISMSMGEATLPAVMITNGQGEQLQQVLTSAPNSNVTISSTQSLGNDASLQDWIAGFSSLGPNGDDAFIKPDMSAPGVSILSATSQEDSDTIGQDYASFNGTSMASPMVAGAAAMLKQQRPTADAKTLKRILISNTDAVVLDMTGERNATAFETGAGRLNIISALSATAYSTTPNLVNRNCVGTCTVSNGIEFAGEQAETWTASIEFDNNSVSATASPSQITLSPTQQVANYSVNVTVAAGLEQQWYFGRVQWRSDQGRVLNAAIAVNNTQVSSPMLQAQITDLGSNTKALNLTSQNLTANAALDVRLNITGGAEFVANSFAVTSGNATTVTTNESQLIELSANVANGSTGFSQQAAPVNIDLSENSEITPLLCDVSGDTDGCDDVLFEVDFDFSHYGESYSKLLLSDNGIVIAGDSVPARTNFSSNQTMPTSAAPNNVIAPFWTDFDLNNPNLANDTGGGDFLLATSTLGERRFLIIQWDKVKLWINESRGFDAAYWGISDPDLEFTFQLILEQGTENKWFRYLSIPEQPNFYTVGVENSSGTVGATYWFDGTGTRAVTSNDTVAVNLGAIDQLQLTVEMAQTENGDFAGADQLSLAEDNTAEINVLANDLASASNAFLNISVADVNSVQSLFEGPQNAELVASTLALVEAPQNGTATVLSEGVIRYVPNPEFSGQDNFSYRISNNAGEQSQANVAVTVAAVNDLPVITNLTGPSSVDAGQTGSFNVTATDVDSTNLTYQWTLPAQLSSSNLTSSELSFTASNVTTDTNVQVSVAVSDGVNTVTRTASLAIEAASSGGGTGGNTGSTPTPANTDSGSSGGSLGYWALLLLVAVRAGRLFKA